MTKEEIRKLLGGYATNTLTESERSALFEAALDDQELFDALQQEQALKNVLDDPSARAEIRAALERSGRSRSPWWIWGGAVGAVAAAAVLVAVFWPRANVLLEERKEIATAEKFTTSPAPPAASPNSPAPIDSLKQAPKPAIRARVPRPAQSGNQALESTPGAPAPPPVPALPPVIPSPVIAGDLSPAQQRQEPGAAALSQGIQNRDQSAGARARNSFVPMASVAGLQTAALRYSLIKQDAIAKDGSPVSGTDLKPGDRIRLRVAAGIPGRIVLQRLDSAGVWQPVANVARESNSDAVVPGDPIVVTAEAQRFRLIFDRAAPEAKAPGTAGQLQAPAVSSPIEITIVAGAR